MSQRNDSDVLYDEKNGDINDQKRKIERWSWFGKEIILLGVCCVCIDVTILE